MWRQTCCRPGQSIILNLWRKTSLWSTFGTTEVVCQMAVSKRLDNAGSTCQGFLRTCLAQCAKSRPTILTCGAKAFDSGRTDSLPRRPRLTSPARNSDDALSLTNISVIMHMCAASFTVPMLLGCFAGIIFYIVESRFVLHEDALLTHGRGDAQQPAHCQGCAPADLVSKLVFPQV